MSSILIAYYSKSGSTKTIAEKLKETLEKENHSVSLYQIGQGDKPDPKQFDVLAIGSPIYFFRIPFNVSDYLKNLPDLSGKGAFFFYTFGTLSGKAPKQLYKGIIKSSATYLGCTRSTGKDYWLGYIKRGVLFSPDSPTEDELKQTENFAKEVSTRIAGETSAPGESFPATPFIYALERFLVNRPFVHLMYSRLFFASKKKCSGCALCKKVCPTGNIIMKNKIPNWGRNCLLCMSCEIFCPEEAITSAFDWPLFAPFMRFNIWNSKKEIACRKVELRNGKILRQEDSL